LSGHSGPIGHRGLSFFWFVK